MNKGLFGNRNPDKYASGEVVFSANQPGPGFVAANGLSTPRYQRGIAKNFGDRMVNGGYASPIWATVQGYFGTSQVTSVAFGNGLWVAAGQSNELRTSSDAVVWTTGALAVNTLGTIAPKLLFANNIWVALSATTTSAYVVRTSTDAVTWTTRTLNIFGSDNPSCLVFQNNTFIGVYSNVGSSSATLIRSTDGITWTSISTLSLGQRVRAVAFGAGRWVAPKQSYIYTSTDAVTWTATASTSNVDGGDAVAFGNNIFVISLSNGIIRTSTDGLIWVTQSSTIAANSDIIFHSPTKQFFAYGANGYLARSFNGLNWTTISTNFGTRTINTLAIQNNIWVAGGTSGAIHRGDARMSYVLPNTANAWVKS